MRNSGSPLRIAGRYELIDDLTSASRYTRVWRARDGGASDVVLKLIPLPKDDAERSRYRDSFAKEVASGKILKGAHIRHLLNAGEVKDAKEIGYPRGFLYLVFEWIEYGDLRRLMRNVVMTSNQVRSLISSIQLGLEEAHSHHIFHRDLKPENILLPEGECAKAKIADFGTARVPEFEQLTAPGMMAGTWRYASPEQFKNSSSADDKADIYSFALIIWECLAGYVPYDCEDIFLTKAARIEAASLGEIVRAGSTLFAVGGVLKRALELDAGKRYASAKEFGTALDVAGIQDSLWKRSRRIEDDISFTFEELLSQLDEAIADGVSPTNRLLILPLSALRAAVNSPHFHLRTLLERLGLRVLDKRAVGGALWVIGDRQLQPVMERLEELNVRFAFKPDGGRTTGYRAAWWTAAES